MSTTDVRHDGFATSCVRKINMARLRFPGRPGYRFDRIGIIYSADEARQTTDPTLAIVSSIHKGLQRFRDLFGDSDEDDFEGFSQNEIKLAELHLKRAIDREKKFKEEQAVEQKLRIERSRATLASLAAQGVKLPKSVANISKLSKTYNKIVATGLVVDSSEKYKKQNAKDMLIGEIDIPKLNGTSQHFDKSAKNHVRLKEKHKQPFVEHTFHRPVGRPKKSFKTSSVIDFSNGGSHESSPALFGTKPASKYTSAAKQILARATKQSALSNSKHLLASSHKVGKFVLPTKSSRSSRVIKPNKRFLEDDNIHDMVTKQPKVTSALPSSLQPNSSTFSLGTSDDKSSTFSPFQVHGLSLSPFDMSREKGFPAFSTAPQPSGTSSFMDGNQKPLGSLDQPLIVEGKRPRKPSLIMRMKLVEDDPEDEIKLQQQISDTISPSKTPGEHNLSSVSNSSTLSPFLKYGGTKSLIAPAKLFTGSSLSLSKSLKLSKGSMHSPLQNTIVLRQPKLQLNRTALNRSKAALARSLKAQLKREAKLERKRRKSQKKLGLLTSTVHSPGSALAQLSPFSKFLGDSVIEKQKSGLFEGIESGAGSFSPGSFSSPPSSMSKLKKEYKEGNYQSSLIKDEDLLKHYIFGTKARCLVCLAICDIRRNRKLPKVPLCVRCKNFYFFQVRTGRMPTTCLNGGQCNVHYKQPHPCTECKFVKFRAVINKSRALGMPFKNLNITCIASKFIHKRRRKKQGYYINETPDIKKEDENTQLDEIMRQKHKSEDSASSVTPAKLMHRSSKSLSSSKDLANANCIQQPLSVDVGAEEPYSLSPPQTVSSIKSSPGRITKFSCKKLVTSPETDDKMSDDDKEDIEKSRGTPRGPRIKHVCRRAAMVFPHQRATFSDSLPDRKTLTLSALPTEEKQQLWAKTKSKYKETADFSNEEDSNDKSFPKLKNVKSPEEPHLAEVKLEQSTDVRPTQLLNQKKSRKPKKILTLAHKVRKKPFMEISSDSILDIEKKIVPYKRKIRCRQCKGCRTPECGVCVFCRDKPKFGGPGRIKKCCIHSVCLAPKIPRKAVAAFIEPKSPAKTNRRDDDDNSGDYRPSNPNNLTVNSGRPSTRFQEKNTSNNQRIDGSGDGVKDNEETDDALEQPDAEEQNSYRSGALSYCGLDMDGSRLNRKTVTNINNRRNFRQAKKCIPVEATIQVALTDIRNPFLSRLPGNFHGKPGIKRRDKMMVSNKQYSAELKPVENETAYCFDVPLKTHLIKADYKGISGIKSAWFHGFSITLTGTTCVRTLCYLCGSAGKQELIFCIVCCQPYHNFCLEEDERPEEPDCDDGEDTSTEDSHHHVNLSSLTWCCRRCQFCHCHRCKDTYHPECLGPNYPTKPSRKNIWVCTKCVRCKSCGATTPGVGTNATWTYDFSLCYECGKLMDKGNFCPICHKCYSDDDWESKMVQCAIYEMYQLVSLLPEEVQFTCRVCSTEKPAYWERVLKSEFSNGLKNVLNALMSSKCAQLLLEAGPPREVKKSKQTRCKTSEDLKNYDDSFSSDTTPDKIVHSSNNVYIAKDSENLQVKQTSDPVTLLDKKIIEKCDCDGTVDIGNNKPESTELNKSLPDKVVSNGLNGFSVDSSALFEFKDSKSDNIVYSNISVIKTSAVSDTNMLKHSVSCFSSSDVGSKTQEQSTIKCSEIISNSSSEVIETKIQNGHVIEALKQSNCDINCTKSSTSCDSLSPRSILSNSDSSSSTTSPMMSAKPSLRETIEQNLGLTVSSTFYGNPSRQSVSKNLFQNFNSNESSVVSSQKNYPATEDTVDSEHVKNYSEMELINNDIPSITEQIKEFTDCDKHVSFEQNIWDTLDKNGEHPRDFPSVKQKIDSGQYISVEEFSEDMVRIIQALLFENELYSTRKKQANSVRSIFVKQMERCFPWFNVNTCKLWEHNRGLPAGMLKDAVLPPSIDHNYAQWLERKDSPMTPQPSPFKKMSSLKKNLTSDTMLQKKSLDEASQGEDTRACLLCTTLGDDIPNHAGRLLYCGQDDWIHINCALWSAEVFESYDGSLQNVQDAVSRGKKLKCDLCQQVGATVGCCAPNCKANYHFMCARKDNCAFLVDQTIFCQLHRHLTEAQLIKDGNFEILRRVCVDMEKIRAKSLWGKAVNPATLSVIIGSCTVEHLGILKSFLSDTEECLYPIDYCSTRIYWSTQDTRRRCVYTCRIIEVKPMELPELHIQDMRIIHDEHHPEFVPLEQLHLDALGIPNFMKPEAETGQASLLDGTREILFRSNDSSFALPDCGTGPAEKFGPPFYDLTPSSPSTQKIIQMNKTVTKAIDLTGLSPSTLALLNIKDPQNYTPPVKSAKLDILPTVDEELGLVRIAERLNNAAWCSHRQGLMDRNISPKPFIFWKQQKCLTNSKSLSSSPVGFRPMCRQRSNSEERYTSPLSPLASNNAVVRVNPALPPGLQQWRMARSRSESPFTSLRCQDITSDRSSSLSPQPMSNSEMTNLIGHASVSSVEVSIEQNDTSLPVSTDMSQTDGSGELGDDNINSLLANVPSEVLDGDSVKVVFVTDPGDLTEEELMKLTLSVLEQNSSDKDIIPNQTITGRFQDNDHLTKGDHFINSDVNVEETGVGDKGSPQDKSKESSQDGSSDHRHGQQATTSGHSPVSQGGTEDGSGDDDDRKPCRGGIKRDGSEIIHTESKTEKEKKSKENKNQSSIESVRSKDDVSLCGLPNKIGSTAEVDSQDTVTLTSVESDDEEAALVVLSETTGLQPCDYVVTGGGGSMLINTDVYNDRKNSDSQDIAGCCSEKNIHSAEQSASVAVTEQPTGTPGHPKSLCGDIPNTSDEESDFLMLDDFSYSETNDEEENVNKSKKATVKTGIDSLSTTLFDNKRSETSITIRSEHDESETDTVVGIANIDVNVSTADIDISFSSPDGNSKTINNIKVMDPVDIVIKPCYVALEKQSFPAKINVNSTNETKNLKKQLSASNNEFYDERESKADGQVNESEEAGVVTDGQVNESEEAGVVTDGQVNESEESDVVNRESVVTEVDNCLESKKLKYPAKENRSQLMDAADSEKLVGLDCVISVASQHLSDTKESEDIDVTCLIETSEHDEDNEKSRSFTPQTTTSTDCDILVIDCSGDELEIVKTEFHTESNISLKTRRSTQLDSKCDESLHEKLLEKIKAESLARSCPGQEGPLKCPTCKRMYRTRESYENHVKSCDFEVSTSDEDEKPIAKQLRSSTIKLRAAHDSKSIPSIDRHETPVHSSSPLSVPLSIIITDEFKEEKFSPSSSRDLSDDCSSQDSRRSSLRKSTMTQRNAAPAHLAKLRRRDSKSTLSPDGSTCSSLLSPTRCSSRIAEDKPSPKATMLEAVGLVSRRSLELSPHSDVDTAGPVKLQPRISPSSLDEAPKREKKSPAQASSGSNLRPSIMAGGLPKPGSSKHKTVTITYNPVVVQEVKIGSRQKRPRPKRVWWVEASHGSSDEPGEDEENDEYDESDNDEGVARRTRNRLLTETKCTEKKKFSKLNISDCGNKAKDGNKTKDDADEDWVAEERAQENQIEVKKKTESLPPLCNEDHREMSQNDTRRIFNLRSSSSKEPISLELPKVKTSKAVLKQPELITDSNGPAFTISDGPEEVQVTKVSSVENSLLQKQEYESVDIIKSAEISDEQDQSDNTEKEVRKVETNDGSEMEDCVDEHDSGVISPLRRSRRTTSKTAKLSEYLAELKKELKDEVDPKPPDDSLSPDKEKRGRGRPRTYPKKQAEMSNIKKKRGRPAFLQKLQSEQTTNENEEKNHLELCQPDLNTEKDTETGKDENISDIGDKTCSVNKRDSCTELNANNEVDVCTSKETNQPHQATSESHTESSSVEHPKQSELCDASGDNRSDHQTDAGGSSTVTSVTGSIGQGTGSSASVNGTAVKDSDAGDAPPSIHPAIDAIKFSGQKLRFIIRSPNIDAAQKIGELIKKRALASNARSSEIIVTTVEPEKPQSREKTVVPEVMSEHTNDTDESGGSKLKQKASDSVESGEASRSSSPDSLSAAYDIQSDDFSSETSNDADDYPASYQEPDSGGAVISLTKNEPTPPPPDQNDDDDDVVIIKAVGLQPPEPGLSQRTPETRSSVASALLSGMASSFSSAVSGPKNMSPVLRYLSPPSQPQMSVQPHFSQPTLNLSPAGQAVNQYMSVQQNQMSPPKNQPQVMLSEVSPGHFILQQNQRPGMIQAQDVTQSNLLLQSQQRMILQHSNQPSLIFRNSGAAGISVQGANQTNMLFANNNSTGLVLQGNSSTFLHGQSTLIQNPGQTGLSFISLNNPTHIRPIISSLQPLQSHTPSPLIQPNMGLAPLMQTASLATNQSLMIGQPFLAQTSMFLPHLATQTITTHSTGIDLAARQISPKPSPRQSSIVIDPHAHMLSSSLNPAMLKGNQQSIVPHNQMHPSNRFNPSPNNPLGTSQSLRLPQLPTNSQSSPSSSLPAASQGTSYVALPKTTPVVARLDGAPTQVNYMGSFDLNSSTLQSVFQTQQLNKDASEKITDIVQRALSNKGQEQIPGVEVKSTITNTPEGPRKFYSVIINEGILPAQNVKITSPCVSSTVTSSSSYTSNIHKHLPVSAVAPQNVSEPDWTKLLPSSSSSLVSSSSQVTQSSQANLDNLWSGSHTGYISIPISQSSNTKPPFRRALKPNVWSSATLSPVPNQLQNEMKSCLTKLSSGSSTEGGSTSSQTTEVSTGQPQFIAQQQSPHRRANFPFISPVKKSSLSAHPANVIKERAKKQIFKKNQLKKGHASLSIGQGFKSPEAELRNVSRRLKTAVKESHHPLIHHKKGNVELPQPTLEEEVVATPLDQGKDFPVGSMAEAEKVKHQSRLKFEITSDDGFTCQGDTVDDAWNQVLEKVQDVRAASRMKQLSYAGISGRNMFGVDHHAVVYLIEQLYGAVYCHRNYKFKFHKYDLDQADAEVTLNPSGAARSEAFSTRKPFDMFNFLKSVYRRKPGDDEREKEEEMALKSSRRATSLSLPMAMRFRKLKTFAKEAVDVYRSKIHGRGLFCKRNIDAGEMVIEYAGEVIRASLTDKREKYYESRGIGCYMFRIDDDEVVDATMHGSAARFINHSCEPNCFSKVILVDGKKHIVIFAMRPIKRGEELTYDYKFPIEEVKIPCSCGSKRCRKYLN
ncbi:hypothetical protein Btru_046482 [Bulinus truncatus]|nr:hypothetical protein Btru_046482 [Bulinus truncatus]